MAVLVAPWPIEALVPRLHGRPQSVPRAATQQPRSPPIRNLAGTQYPERRGTTQNSPSTTGPAATPLPTPPRTPSLALAHSPLSPPCAFCHPLPNTTDTANLQLEARGPIQGLPTANALLLTELALTSPGPPVPGPLWSTAHPHQTHLHPALCS